LIFVVATTGQWEQVCRLEFMKRMMRKSSWTTVPRVGFDILIFVGNFRRNPAFPVDGEKAFIGTV
jgi:hypothetical protein